VNPALLPLLDLLAELLASELWREARGPHEGPDNAVSNPNPAAGSRGSVTSPGEKPGNPGPSPTVPANSRSHSRPSPTTPQTAQPSEAKEDR
jgi:hypothetical protein